MLGILFLLSMSCRRLGGISNAGCRRFFASATLAASQFLARSGGSMTDIPQSPQLLRLCELASKEHDPQQLVPLIPKTNQELDELMGESELSLPEAADRSRPIIPCQCP